MPEGQPPLQAEPAGAPTPRESLAALAIKLPKLMRLLSSAWPALLAQGALHGQLARVEWAEEKQRLLRMLALSLFGLACLLCALLLLNGLALALSWDTAYRIPTLLALIIAHALGAVVAWRHLRRLSARADQAFAATREELAAVITLLKSKL